MSKVCRNYCYQHHAELGAVGNRVWVDVPMLPPGSGAPGSTVPDKEVWVAYLNYLRVVHPNEAYRLTETTTTVETEVLDV